MQSPSEEVLGRAVPGKGATGTMVGAGPCQACLKASGLPPLPPTTSLGCAALGPRSPLLRVTRSPQCPGFFPGDYRCRCMVLSEGISGLWDSLTPFSFYGGGTRAGACTELGWLESPLVLALRPLPPNSCDWLGSGCCLGKGLPCSWKGWGLGGLHPQGLCGKAIFQAGLTASLTPSVHNGLGRGPGARPVSQPAAPLPTIFQPKVILLFRKGEKREKRKS